MLHKNLMPSIFCLDSRILSSCQALAELSAEMPKGPEAVVLVGFNYDDCPCYLTAPAEGGQSVRYRTRCRSDFGRKHPISRSWRKPVHY